jgi:acetate kinase
MKQEKLIVLAMNGDSSSIKFALYTKGDEAPRRLHGKVDPGLGYRSAYLSQFIRDKLIEHRTTSANTERTCRKFGSGNGLEMQRNRCRNLP